MKIFGIGNSRTGTSTLHSILTQLGLKSKHFIPELLCDSPDWGIISDYDALCDSPIPLLFKECDLRFPNSKFILTMRNKFEWLDSMEWLFTNNKFKQYWDEKTIAYHKRFYGTRTYNKNILEEHWENFHYDVNYYFRNRPQDLLIIDIDEGFILSNICKFLELPYKEIVVEKNNRRTSNINRFISEEKVDIKVCVAFDEKFFNPARVLITSILVNSHQLDDLTFFVLDGGISNESKLIIDKLKRIKDFRISYIPINNNDYKEFPITAGTHFNIVSWYRIKIPSLIPEIDKIIYLDCDTIVKKSLRDLYRIDLSNKILAGAISPNSINNCKRLNIPDGYEYINSGVLVLNIKLWKENKVESVIKEFILNASSEMLLNVDQDAINGALFESIEYIDQRWNVEYRNDIDYPDYYYEILKDPFLIHYVSYDKPWHAGTKQNSIEYDHYFQIAEDKILFDDTNGSTILDKVTLKRLNFEMYTKKEYSWKYVDIVFEEMTALLVNQLSKGIKTFVDIGAHYGFYSVLVGRSNPTSKIFAFEPVPDNFEILNKNVKLHGIKANTKQFAVSNFKGNSNFQVSKITSQSGFQVVSGVNFSKSITVEVVQIDQFLEQLSSEPVMIKIDTEGHELFVIRGMKVLLSKLHNITMIVEFNPGCLEVNGISPQNLLDEIFSLGFEIIVIKDVERSFQKISPKDDWSDFMGERTYRSLLCIRKEESINLCFFSHSSQINGATRSLFETINQLTIRGAICTVVLPEDGPLIKRLEDIGVAVQKIDFGWWCSNPLHSNEEKMMDSKRSYTNLILSIESLKSINPDVIITNTIVFPWGAIAANLLNKPHIWWIKEFGEIDHGLRFFMPFQKIIDIIKQSSNQIFVNSYAVQETLFGEDKGTNCRVIRNNITLDQNISDYYPIFRNPNSFKIAVIGYVMKSKGQVDAILAIELLTKKGFDVELCIVGDGDPEFLDEINHLLSLNHLEESIHLLGSVENVINILKQVDTCLVCSKNEAFGRVTAEAMLMKKTVIGTNTGGTKELISSGHNGYLYSPGNYSELAGRIEYLIKNPKKLIELGNTAYHNIKELLSENPADEVIIDEARKIRGEKNPNAYLLQEYINYLSSLTLNNFVINENNIKVKLAEREEDLISLATSRSWNCTRIFRKLLSLLKSKTNV